MSKVVLSGYYGFDNFGDEAILQVLINNLKNIDADVLLILTAIDKVKIHYKKENEEGLSKLSIDDAKRYISEGEFADRKSTRLNSSHPTTSRMPSSA